MRQLSLFDEYISDKDEENTIEEIDGYSLVQDELNTGKFKYKVFDDDGILCAQWDSSIDCMSMKNSDYKKSPTRDIFLHAIREDKKDKKAVQTLTQTAKNTHLKKTASNPYNYRYSAYDYLYGDEEDDTDISDHKYYNSHPIYTYTPPARKTGYLEKCNKSDTLVFHKTDPSTTMLEQIYKGKGWDVINDTYIDKDEIRQLIESHDRIVMLGHGSPAGLIGGNIGPEEAPYLAGKKMFVIWCNADQFFHRYLPNEHGFFCTQNMPSEASEAAWVGFHVSEPYMNENITYWCKLCGDVCERALNGDPEGAVKYVRDKYWEKYGDGYDVNAISDDSKVKQDIPDEVRITKYNWIRTRVQ